MKKVSLFFVLLVCVMFGLKANAQLSGSTCYFKSKYGSKNMIHVIFGSGVDSEFRNQKINFLPDEKNLLLGTERKVLTLDEQNTGDKNPISLVYISVFNSVLLVPYLSIKFYNKNNIHWIKIMGGKIVYDKTLHR